MITLKDVKEAQGNLKGIIRRTPLFYSSTISRQSGCEIYLKYENKQKTGSFKLRGAYNKICSLSEQEKKNGVIASSAGNHAQGVAYAAKAFGIKSIIVMPITAPLTKVQATKHYGAEVIQYGEVYDECYDRAIQVQQETGATFVHPFNDDKIIAGQGTIALEILDDIPDVDVIVVPIGGGGLISGIAIAAKEINPNIKIIGVQAEIIASSKISLLKNRITTLPGVKSLADGISVKTPGEDTFKYMRKYIDDIVTVSEDEIASGIFTLIERNKILAEGAGAATVAALLSGKIKEDGKKVVAVISGGNIDIAMVSKIIDRGLVMLKRRINISIEIQDKVGELSSVISEIVRLGGNISKTRQDKTWNSKGLDFTNVAFEIETQSKEHADTILFSLENKGYKFMLLEK